MIRNEKFLILSAESTHFIIQLEKNLLEKNIPCRVIPLPTEISANCGLAIRVEIDYIEEIKKIIIDENIKVTMSIIEKNGFKKKIEKIYEEIQGE